MKLTIGLPLAFAFYLSSCGGRPESTSSTISTVMVRQNQLWQSRTIPVCWEGESPETADLRAAIGDFINASVNRTVLKLTGWNLCQKDSRGIRIFIYDEPLNEREPSLANLKRQVQFSAGGVPVGHPRAQDLGRILDGRRAGLILTSQFKSVEPFLTQMAQPLTAHGKRNLLLSISLHEMGHALGMLHEDTHPGATCKEYREPMGGGTVVTPFNFYSIMSRCYYRDLNYEKGRLGMNKRDVEGINQAYAFLRR